MRRILIFSFVVGLLASGSMPAFAQGQVPMGPPKYLLIFREEIKPGRSAGHYRVEKGYVNAFRRSKSPVHYLAITSETGPSEAWFVEPHDSIAEIEEWQHSVRNDPALVAELDRLEQRDGEFRSGQRSIVAKYREDLSYRASVNIAQMRYFNITTIRVRPGHDADLAEARRIINAAHERADMDEHWAVFQVVSGAPSGTYYVFLPMKSMKELDRAEEIHGKGYEAALGEENQRRLRELASAAVLSTESMLFAFSPGLSVLPEEMIASDPEFWRPKPKPAARPSAAKPGPTKPAGTP